MSNEVKIKAIVKLNELGGTSTYESTTDKETLSAMVNSDYVTIYNRTIKVLAVQVIDNGNTNFYGEEIKEFSDGNTIPFNLIENE